ncbi:MAG: hypothetical protein RL091_1311 [Verrucomicrobiota bacterium]|jgi:uncharacterized protein (DUF58 family)
MSVPATSITSPSPVWDGPGAPAQPRRQFDWHALLWLMVFPKKRHRIALTVPGLFLMALALGIGTAAYNTASNILFLTLSLLLACLLLSGLLSWFNLMGACWRLRTEGPWRSGHETLVSVDVHNQKRWLPTYSLWFELATQPRRIPEPEDIGRELKMREILAAAEKHITRGLIHLPERVDAGSTTTLSWNVRPARRGEAWVDLLAVGSLFPFGFLKKSLGTELRQPVLVWPAQVEYQWIGATAARGGAQGRRTSRAGTGDDLLALRKYQMGDSHRLIHWKASARLGRMMVRQFAAETHDGYELYLDPAAAIWVRPEQFELVCSLAATLAEDLFASGRLRAVRIEGGPGRDIRRVRDLEAWLDDLARLTPQPAQGAGSREQGSQQTHNVITFAPEGARGVTAYVDGRKTASA